MAVLFSPWGNQQFFDESGNPATGWKIYSYTAGSSTALATYTTSTGSVSQSNPVVLDALGFSTGGQIWLTSGLSYKLVLTDANGIVKKTEDNITGVTGAGTTSQWQASGLTPTYVSATSFTLAGDQTTNFEPRRRLQFTTTAGTVYGTIFSSAYAALTTVTVLMDGTSVLDSGLSAVNLSILTATNPSLPKIGFTFEQFVLAKSGANLVLSPAKGNLITVNGFPCTIPDAGVTLAPTALSATTLYYIYAVATAGVISSLEASVTIYTTSTSSLNRGTRIKTGDETRTLVGMAYVETAATFTDTDAKKFTRSSNDRGIIAKNNFGADATSAVTAGFAEIAAGRKAQFITWAGENITAYASGATFNSGANVNRTGLGLDSVTVAQDGAGQAAMTAANTPIPQAVLFGQNSISEGLHYITMLGYVSAGTGTWTGTSPLAWTWSVTTNGRT